MRTTRFKNKLLQKFYTPKKSKVINVSNIKGLGEIESFLNDTLGKKNSKDKDKKNKDDNKENKE